MAGSSPNGSVRTRLGFIPDDFSYSVDARRQQLGLAGVQSLAFLLNEASPEVRTQSASLKAGDIKAEVKLNIASNGEFSASVYMKDNGVFFGDKYAIFVGLSSVAPDKTAFGFLKKGAIDQGDVGGFTETGRSFWLYENWDTAKSSSIKAHLVTSWDVGVDDILRLLLYGAGVFLVGYGAATGTGRFRPNESGGVTYEVTSPPRDPQS